MFHRVASGSWVALLFVAAVCHVVACHAAGEPPEDQRAWVAKQLPTLLRGVTELSTPGIPGPLCVYGPTAFPVVVDTKDGQSVPVVAAARWGDGRLVAFSHNGYFGDLVTQHPMTGQLVANSIAWSAGKPSVAGVKVAVRGYRPVRQLLAKSGAVVRELPNEAWIARIDDAQVVVADLQQCTPGEVATLVQFVRSGGGFVAANLVWGWEQSHQGLDPAVDHPGNQLISAAGMVWADGYAPTTYGAKIPVTPHPSEFAHVGSCLDALDRLAHREGDLSSDDLRAVSSTLSNGYGAIPPTHDAGVLGRLRAIVTRQAGQIPVPAAEAPIPASQPYRRLLVALANEVECRQTMDELHASPAAVKFPGVPVVEARRTRRRVTITPGHTGWQSTGLYALPGERIQVATEEATARQGFTLQIGCHRDNLSNVAAPWKRSPMMIRRFALTRPNLEIGHALGGLIYVDVPDQANASSEFTIEFSGAIEAPYYFHGKTTSAQWNTLRNAPAPWAELQTENVVLTVPSALVRKLGFPDRLMTHWTQVVDACADLATIPHQRRKAERIVFDVQISAGFMHSGYPIMAHLDPSAPEAVSLDHLQSKGGWGFYHELGHNHQRPAWTFDGTVEVTCNLFSLYVLETVTPGAFTHPAIQPAERRDRERAYLAGGARFEKWKADPFLALIVYQQLQEAFGWDAYQKVFAEYRQLSPDELPKTEEQKRDQWMVRFSRKVGKNLGPFFQQWGIPTSTAARHSIAELPEWMPPRHAN